VKRCSSNLKKKCSSDTSNDFSIKEFKAKKSRSTLENNKEKFSKLVVPVHPYRRDIPRSNKADEKEPKIKYFKPASVEKEEFFLEAANTYKHKLCISIARYNDIKS